MKLADEVSQDLRPPLTVIRGCLETVVSHWDVLDATQRAELLDAALKGAEDLACSVEMLEARLVAVQRSLDERAPAAIALDG